MDDETRLPDDASVHRTGLGTVTSRDLTASGSWGRFEPGAVFAGRFRIVAPLGKGGMGEVYRADDLKLGQTVDTTNPSSSSTPPDWTRLLSGRVRDPLVGRDVLVGVAGGSGDEPLFGRVILD